MDLYFTHSQSYVTEDSKNKCRNFKALPNDVIINTAPKSGSTWIQMICQSLRSNGDMSFEDIDEIIPLVFVAHDAGIDVNEDQKWKPRVFKFHNAFEKLPNADNIKYILCIRNPADVAISHYHFLRNWMLPNEVTLTEFTRGIYLQDTDPELHDVIYIWNGILNFYPRRHDPNVLYLHYEDLIENLREGVKLIANFLEIKADDKLIDLVTHQSNIKFMSKHREKFRLKRLKKSINKNAGVDLNSGLNEQNKGYVRVGATGQKISEEIDLKFEKKWKRNIEKKLGFASYHELRKATNKELRRPFYT